MAFAESGVAWDAQKGSAGLPGYSIALCYGASMRTYVDPWQQHVHDEPMLRRQTALQIYCCDLENSNEQHQRQGLRSRHVGRRPVPASICWLRQSSTLLQLVTACSQVTWHLL